MPVIKAESLLLKEPKEITYTINGKPKKIKYPFKESKYRQMGAGYFVPIEILQKFLPSPTISLAESMPGMGTFNISIVEYSPNEIFPTIRYQFAMQITVDFKAKENKEKINGAYVMVMGLCNNKEMVDWTRGMGFNYEFAEISLKETANDFKVTVQKDKKIIAEFSGKKKPMEPQAITALDMNVINNQLVPVIFMGNGKGSMVMGADAEYTLKLGDHPLGKKIEAMKMAPNPVMGFQILEGSAEVHVTDKKYTL